MAARPDRASSCSARSTTSSAEHSAGYYQFWRDGSSDGGTRRIDEVQPVEPLPAARGRQDRRRHRRRAQPRPRRGIFDTAFSSARRTSRRSASSVDATPQCHPARAVPHRSGSGSSSALIIWFATRGGVETFFPDDIKTRFSDVWGQDQVLEKVKENLIFLENPEIDRGARAATCPAASSSGARPAPARRSWPRRSRARPASPFVNVDAGACSTRSWASACSR